MHNNALKSINNARTIARLPPVRHQSDTPSHAVTDTPSKKTYRRPGPSQDVSKQLFCKKYGKKYGK